MGFFANPVLWASTLTLTVPIALAAIGATFSERGGVVNIAMEGLMEVGALIAVVVAAATRDAWLGAAAGTAAGALAAVLLGWASLHLRADQIVTGMAVNVLFTGLTSAGGLTGFLLVALYGQNGTPVTTPQLPLWRIPGLDAVPFLGQVLSGQIAVFYIFLALLVAAQFALFRTRWGLRLRSVGENPHAADSLGVGVIGLKWQGVLISGALSGLAGAYLSIGTLNLYNTGMVAGRGFIALAAVIVGGWNPAGAALVSLVFGFLTAATYQLQTASALPKNLVLMIPYLVTIVVLAAFARRVRAPAADGVVYEPRA
ncbi:MAG: ABC transporter permease [Firmicutes bacterium]|nr:ABC transporter permease [Bacillota bacterium]